MKLYRIYRSAICTQVEIARNLDESLATKGRRAFWFFAYSCRAVRRGFSAVRREQLGSRVVYRGRKCFVSNWAQSVSPTLTDGSGFYEERCSRAEIVNIISLAELLHRFSCGSRLYVDYWMSIDINRRLYG